MGSVMYKSQWFGDKRARVLLFVLSHPSLTRADATLFARARPWRPC